MKASFPVLWFRLGCILQLPTVRSPQSPLGGFPVEEYPSPLVVFQGRRFDRDGVLEQWFCPLSTGFVSFVHNIILTFAKINESDPTITLSVVKTPSAPPNIWKVGLLLWS